MPKLCKIWNNDRSVRKAVAAENLQQLVEKARGKLGFSKKATITVVLEVDGTQVQDDDYFNSLPNGTRFLLLGENDAWTNGLAIGGGSSEDQADGPPRDGQRPLEIDAVLGMLRQDIAKIVTLEQEELDALLALNPDHLAKSLDVPHSQALRIQAKCQRYLDEQQDSQEALDLIRMIGNLKESGHGSQQSSFGDSIDGGTTKTEAKSDGCSKRKRKKPS